MKLNYISIILLSGTLLATVSCKDVLQTEPRQSISAEGALSSITGVNGLLTNVYDNIQGSGLYGRDVIIQSEVLSDNCRIAVSNSNRFINEYNNTLRSHFDDFTSIYPIINKCNLILDNVDQTTDGTAAQKASVKGQALFIRAWMYFTLVNEYAYNPKQIVNNFDLGVPLILTGVSSATTITYPERAKVTQVYTQIKKDLADAVALLDNTGGKTSIGKAAAQAMLSRVSLYNGEWQAAVDQATAAINSGIATFVSTPTAAGYASIFNQKISPESIFELNYEITESLGTNSIQNIYQRLGNSSTSSSGYGDVIPQANLLNAYETNDVRRPATLIAVVKAGEPIFWIQKYPGSGGQFSVDNIRVIRISEMYLNRAEAYARLGGANEALALNDLNRIRNRAGLPSVAFTGAALVDAILKERRIELAYEGHRWFDLVRTGSDIVKDNGTVPYTDIRILAPIPLAELDVNPALQPNPGY